MTARTSGFAILVLGAGLACACVGGGVAIFGRWAATFEDWGAPTVEAAFTMLVFGLLAGVGIAAARFEGFRAGALGPNAAGWAAAGVAIGAGGMMAALADAHLAGVVVPGLGGGAGALSLLGGAGVVLAQSASEEVFFRGWLQRSLARRWGGWPAVVAAALAFSLAHLAGGARGPLTLVNLTLGGLVFGGMALRTGGLAAAIAAHWGWNAAEQLLFGLDPNPGVGSFGALVDRDLVGATLWGGSGEGLNAGLPMTLVLVAMLAGVTLAGGVRTGRAEHPTAPTTGR